MNKKLSIEPCSNLDAYSDKNLFWSLLKKDKKLSENYDKFKMIFKNELIVSNTKAIEESLKNFKLDYKQVIKPLDSKFLDSLENDLEKFDYEVLKYSENDFNEILSFSSNELLNSLKLDENPFIEEGSTFKENTVSFDNTTEITMNVLEIKK
ncbi:hypothetical protein [Mycoplasmopsis adleri]|uniref:hypothetical protein n=1 Tax=Mycoplasmopsis adleri TaxID=51362 RepID=UPI0038732273